MKLIIELKDETYKFYKENALILIARGNGRILASEVYDAIANGMPLPKGHGKLIEEPTEADISNTVGGNNDFAECIRDSVKAVFENVATIIEAEKEDNSGT